MTELATYFSSLGALQIIGLFGFFVYVFAFAAVQWGYLNGNSAHYSLLNVLAASMVAISLISEFNLPSALIQGSWIAIGIFGLFLRFYKTQKISTRGFPKTLNQEMNS